MPIPKKKDRYPAESHLRAALMEAFSHVYRVRKTAKVFFR